MPDISWTTEYAQLVQGLKNCYAEIGTTWASTVVTFPTVCAHIMGQLLKYMGKERVVFGSDSLWYGSPQWQIEAMWRFEIPEELRQRYGYPRLDEDAKRRILGLNSAKLYGLQPSPVAEKGQYRPVPVDYQDRMPNELKTLLEFKGYADDNLSRFKADYAAMDPPLSNTRYGWILTKA